MAEISDYITKGRRHEGYHKTVELYHSVKRHAQGDKQIELITERRPSESDDIKAYREKILVAITKGEGVGLVINALGKIRRSSDWMIKYPQETNNINDKETLEQYCEKNFPFYQSVTYWAFTALLKEYVTDANAVILVTPLVKVKSASDYLKPVCLIFNSPDVYELTDDEALLKSSEKAYFDTDDQKWKGNVYYHVTTEKITRLAETKGGKALSNTLEIEHKFGVLPIVKTKGIYSEIIGNTPIFESRLSPMIPRLDEFMREYSDCQSEIVQHLNSRFWTTFTQDCTTCMFDGMSTGKIKKGNKNVVCPDCGGSTKIVQSPYKTMVARAPKTNMGEQKVSGTDLAGFITYDTAIVKIQMERLDAHMYKAFCAIAMQHLYQMPLNTSGYKKELDMDESITFITNVAEDMINVLDKIYFFINEWRYADHITNVEKRRKMLPTIPVPQRFDIISTDYLMQELGKAKTANINPLIIRTMEAEIISKKFGTEPEIRDALVNVLELDPLPSYSVDEKLSMLQSNGITEEDFIISCNIQSFVKRAKEEDEKFYEKKFEDKMDKMKEFAQEIMSAEKEEIITETVDPLTGLPLPTNGKPEPIIADDTE